MKITIERSGGFAGISTTFSADDGTLNLAEKQQLERLLRSSKFFDMPLESPAAKTRGAADYFIYRITVEKDPGKSHTVETTDVTMDQSLRSIVDILESRRRTSNT
jgi:hypothetical protein